MSADEMTQESENATTKEKPSSLGAGAGPIASCSGRTRSPATSAACSSSKPGRTRHAARDRSRAYRRLLGSELAIQITSGPSLPCPLEAQAAIAPWSEPVEAAQSEWWAE
jgi:hypothetical protein